MNIRKDKKHSFLCKSYYRSGYVDAVYNGDLTEEISFCANDTNFIKPTWADAAYHGYFVIKGERFTKNVLDNFTFDNVIKSTDELEEGESYLWIFYNPWTQISRL